MRSLFFPNYVKYRETKISLKSLDFNNVSVAQGCMLETTTGLEN